MEHAAVISKDVAGADPPSYIAAVLQPSLFADPDPELPPGMRYTPDLLSPNEEAALVERIEALPFAPFAFHGYEGLRRVASFGWRYDFSAGRADRIDPIPDWLEPLKARAAAWAGLAPEALEQALVNEYAPGAPIGWHRDRPVFEDVIGVSFLSPCVMRFRRRSGAGWDRRAAPLAARSAYLLRGEARNDWEHSIAPAKSLRYSVTFRSRR